MVILKSLTIRKVEKFNVDDSLPLLKDDTTIGNIAPTERSFVIERTTFTEFHCTYYVDFNDTIIVEVDGNLNTVDNYKKSSSFSLYFSDQKNLLFVDAPTAISANFLNNLEQKYPDKIKTNIFAFDFQKISEHQNNSKAIYFAVDDAVIDSKTFYGNGVHQDIEAIDAIDNQNATYIMAEIDLQGQSRTVGFSKKGATVIYSKPIDLEHLERPYLLLSYEAATSFSL